MNRELKGILAEAVIHHVAEIFDRWEEFVAVEPRLAEVDADEAALVVGRWMRRLPGYGWDDRFPPEETHRP